jgi:hypothetical protein
MIRLLLVTVVLLFAPAAHADALFCQLHPDAPVPIYHRQCAKHLNRWCHRLCFRKGGKYPEIAFCKACQTFGGPCAIPLPTPAECCAAGHPVVYDGVDQCPTLCASSICTQSLLLHEGP